ncbi:MAG: DUF2442 domain-containing protein [Piscirickettsiaceae bacterium CG_4_9_14_3_um_filter_43_564]|nr:DUF2442 domain-containing protein [Thiomicrospira sp.]OIP96269.1 MAG: hypothetical protein AUK56_02560 [Thiomicrospira sp. CG2_30_44_34]PIQ04303.1 MAG: hypothetical protein COW74_05355 [Piscirickettsiaceae bacterium CG18_big_fil_WC_8_21_14_2_50_44_103]PIU37786.1 MAG: DUF2442 domain-containing protein [Piscirickettsiaceae bacterium CG07_land_8_20_14_0_80_44_28]PIW58062.1 MAG: DUF2442 domain-containing protein [Piscirickettsiaceae bacterium CG12_big_fil_rev_8_21_14_0_65_44_934]PIW77592.1 MAG:
MATLQINNNPKVELIHFTDAEMQITLDDGRKLSIPLAWYKTLFSATKEQLATYELIGDGEGVHWPLLDEDLSVKGFLMGISDMSPQKIA